MPGSATDDELANADTGLTNWLIASRREPVGSSVILLLIPGRTHEPTQEHPNRSIKAPALRNGSHHQMGFAKLRSVPLCLCLKASVSNSVGMTVLSLGVQ